MAQISVRKFQRKRFNTLPFDGHWADLIGTPELSGSWIIYGESHHGKSTLALKLARYMAAMKKVIYVSLEESHHLSFQESVKRVNLISVEKRIILEDFMTLEQLDAYLQDPKSADVIFIDSLQYLRKNEQASQEITKFEYHGFVKKYEKNKLFIFVSHAENGKPKGSLAGSVKFHAHVGLMVENHTVYPTKSRFGGKMHKHLSDL